MQSSPRSISKWSQTFPLFFISINTSFKFTIETRWISFHRGQLSKSKSQTIWSNLGKKSKENRDRQPANIEQNTKKTPRNYVFRTEMYSKYFSRKQGEKKEISSRVVDVTGWKNASVNTALNKLSRIEFSRGKVWNRGRVWRVHLARRIARIFMQMDTGAL